MKIVFISNGLLDTDCYPHPNQGGSVQTWGLAQELAKRHQVFIVRRYQVDGKNFINSVHLINIKFKGLENIIKLQFMSAPFFIARIISSFYFSIKAIQVIRSINPDFIIIIDRFSGLLPSFLNYSKIYVVHVSDAMDFSRNAAFKVNKINYLFFYLKNSIEKIILKKVNITVVLNEYIRKFLVDLGYRSIIKLNNGISLNEFNNYGECPYILYAGRFDKNKNVLSLLNAFHKISNIFTHYKKRS